MGESATALSASDLAAHRAHYVNLATNETAIVLILDSRGRVDSDLTARVAAALHGSGAAFTPAFVGEGLFEKAYKGDGSVIRELGLPPQTSVVLGVSQSRVTSRKARGMSVTQSNVRVKVREFHAPGHFGSRSITVDATATGDADATATERAADTAAHQLLARLGHTKKGARSDRSS